MKQTTPYSLIAKHLAKESSRTEEQMLFEWREASTDNEKLFIALCSEWELLKDQESSQISIPNKAMVWENIQRSIQSVAVTHKISYSKHVLMRIAASAAIVALVIGFSIAYFALPSKVGEQTLMATTIVAPEGQKTQLLLADGTEVWLNSGSKITYNNQFGLENRKITLEGEAFFDVKKNEELRFEVDLGKVSVNVHGTAFNINSYSINNEISVALIRGLVSIVNLENNSTLSSLNPGEQIVLNKKDLSYKLRACDIDTEGLWRLDRLKFEGEDLHTVAKKLSNWFGVEIELANVDTTKQYWFSVRNENLEDILKSMNNLHSIRYTIDGKKVKIRGQ